jgi:signal peptidase I
VHFPASFQKRSGAITSSSGKAVWFAVAALPLLAGCGAATAALHGHRRYTAPSEGMEPTIHAGQTFDVRPVRGGKYRPKRGDVVVFDMPGWSAGPSRSFVKRVVAIAGDRIARCSNDKVTLNGAPLAEPYVASTSGAPFDPVTVPAGRIWVMGDNRAVSSDSRLPGHGPIPASSVIGVAVLK